MKEIEIENLSGSLGKDLVKAIYSNCYRLDATYVVVKKSKFNRYALCELHCKDGCIAWDYEINVIKKGI